MALATATQAAELAGLKGRVRSTIDERGRAVARLAHEIHDHPEIAFAEHRAAARIGEFLAAEGFTVRVGAYGVPTAFVASIGHGPLHVAFCAEYDAMPEVGHVCGHNVIAGAAVAAAVGLREVADDIGLTVSVIGTPAEELLGHKDPPAGHLVSGKIMLLEAGAFDGVHAALMVHPGPGRCGAFIAAKAFLRVRARFSPARPGARSPSNDELRALEKAMRRSVISLHQTPHLCIARRVGQDGDVQADLTWAARSLVDGMRGREAVRRCFEDSATAAGLAVQITDYRSNHELRNDPLVARSYRKNAGALGRVVPDRSLVGARPWWRTYYRIGERLMVYGTDLGNVSQVIPAIHPILGIGRLWRFPHQVKFADQADTDEAYRAMLDGGLALAWTGVDAAIEPALNAYLLESAASRVGSNTTAWPRLAI
jgi:metal-dependent amidase/aminoacylase/carboxypeptidase family protein